MARRTPPFASTPEACEALLGGTTRSRKKARSYLRSHGEASCCDAVLAALRDEVAKDAKRPRANASSIDELLEILISLELEAALPTLQTLSNEASMHAPMVYWTLGEALQLLDRTSPQDARYALACIDWLEAHESPLDGAAFAPVQCKLSEFEGCLRGMAKLRLIPERAAIERMLGFAERWAERMHAPNDDEYFNPRIYVDPRSYLALIGALWPEELVRPFLLKFRDSGQAEDSVPEWIDNALARDFRPPWQGDPSRPQR